MSSTRRVRGQSGAIFEVDPSMLDVGEERAVDYRGSSAPPHVTRIVGTRPPARADWSRLARPIWVLITALLALMVLASLVRAMIFG